jgi:hypothetical protein
MGDDSATSKLQIQSQGAFDVESQVHRTHYTTTFLRAPKLSRNEASTISALILPEEKLISFTVERRLHGALLNPAIVLVTDKRTIIINRKYLRLKSDIAFIKHESVVSFRVVHGIVFSSVQIRQAGTSDSSYVFGGVKEGEIRGFSREGANAIANGINYAVHIKARQKPEQAARSEAQNGMSSWVYHFDAMNTLQDTTALRVPYSSSYNLSTPETFQRATERDQEVASIDVESGPVNGESTQQVQLWNAESEDPQYPPVQAGAPQAPGAGFDIPSDAPNNPVTERASVLGPAAGQPQTAEAAKAGDISQNIAGSDQHTHITPDDLLIFKLRNAREVLNTEYRRAADGSIRYPEPIELISGDFQSNRPSLFYGLLSRIKRMRDR